MRFKVIVVLILTLIWSVGSWKWYTCNIKGFCGDGASLEEGVAPAITPVSVLNANDDSDHDGLTNKEESQLGLNPNSTDSDGDGYSDRKEVGEIRSARDTDNDGIIDALDADDDNDGISTSIEYLLATSAYLADSDNDGLLDNYEIGDDQRNPIDTDRDGIIDAVDSDDDNDGLVTRDEQADPNGDGNPSDAIDADSNGVADYLDVLIEETIDEPELYEAPTQVEIVIGEDQHARVHFPFNSASSPDLSAQTESYFVELVSKLQMGKTVLLIGHTDDIGDAQANEKLALLRAKMIAELLVERGASAGSISVDSKGELEPIASNETELGRGTNRRVEIAISQ